MARAHAALDRLDLVLSEVPLGKEELEVPSLSDRLAVLEQVVRSRPWLGVRTTGAQLIADVAAGYDVVVMGADKWAQVNDVAWYPSVAARDAALARLPPVLLVAREPVELPPALPVGVELLVLRAEHAEVRTVSSTGAREGRREWMVAEAIAFDERTGAWSDPERYRRGRRREPGRDPG